MGIYEDVSGSQEFYTDSNGQSEPNPKFYRTS